MSPDRPAVIFTEAADWHSNRLKEAIERRGVRAMVLSLGDCQFAVGSSDSGLWLGALGPRLPLVAFVRVIADGTTEQITFRLSLLHALFALGVPVCNDARAIERCVDKGMTSFLLARAGLPTPATWVTERADLAQGLLDSSADGLVLKPLFGAQGRGLKRLAADALVPGSETVDGVFYLQRFVDSRSRHDGEDWQDRRVLVIGGRPVAAMTRHGNGWITNVHQGARCVAVPVDDDAANLAVAAAEAVGAAHAGVDLIRNRDGGWFVLEVNSMPAWRGLQSTTPIDLADALAADLLARAGADLR